MGCILHTTNIELRPRLVSLGRFFCSILLGYSLLGISPKPFNLFYYSGRFCEKRPNRSDCLPNYNCAIPTCYIRPCLNWCKIGVIHSTAIPSKYRFPRHYSGLVGSLCIFSAFKYTVCAHLKCNRYILTNILYQYPLCFSSFISHLLWHAEVSFLNFKVVFIAQPDSYGILMDPCYLLH